MKIAVVDDERTTLNIICNIIKEHTEKDSVIDAYESSVSFFKNIDKLVYDIVLLDIDMPEIGGFQLAETLKLIKPDITIIFVSNLEHLVFQSLEYKPFRFIRKSKLEEDISSAINSYQREISLKGDVFFF